jgi:hypothetical protein
MRGPGDREAPCHSQLIWAAYGFEPHATLAFTSRDASTAFVLQLSYYVFTPDGYSSP